MLQWDKNQRPKGDGIFGQVVAFVPAHEEQGRKTLHSHWQIWVEDSSPQILEDLFNSDVEVQMQNRAAFYHYVDQVMCATYSRQLNFEHECNENSKRSNAVDISMNNPVDDVDCYLNNDDVITSVSHRNNDVLGDNTLSDVPPLLTRFHEDDQIDDILDE